MYAFREFVEKDLTVCKPVCFVFNFVSKILMLLHQSFILIAIGNKNPCSPANQEHSTKHSTHLSGELPFTTLMIFSYSSARTINSFP